jgi:hypothetical protein
VCPRPTAAREPGDAEWTAGEQRRAAEKARSIYPGRFAARDAEATVRLLEAGRSEEGALALLRFFGQLEAERLVHTSRFSPPYLELHPSSNIRAATVRQAASSHRRD